jgi:hypothetical protein
MMEDEGGQEGSFAASNTKSESKGIVAGGDAPKTPWTSRLFRSVYFLFRGRNQLLRVTRK